jgi:diguanylate cyclase (GGDEF)-like protein
VQLTPLHPAPGVGPVYSLGFTALITEGDDGEDEVVGIVAFFGMQDWILAPRSERLINDGAPHVARALKNARTLADIRRLTTEDHLTGALNRRGFEDGLRREAERARRSGHAMSLITIDVDHFKGINDLFGHAVGDAVLQAVTGSSREMLRRSDLLCRMGGDEFVIILPETEPAAAEDVARRLSAACAEIVVPDSDGRPAVTVSLSMGVAGFEAGCAEGPIELLRRADDALYGAKRAGRGCIRGCSGNQ